MTRHLKKATLAIVRSNQQLCFVSQDVELPEQPVGLTNVRRSILKKSCKRSPRAYLELKHTKTAYRFVEIREELSRVDWNIIGTPTRQILRTEMQTTRGGKMMQEKQLGTGPNSRTEFAELTWRTKLNSSNQRWNSEWHLPQPSVQTRDSLLFILEHSLSKMALSPEELHTVIVSRPFHDCHHGEWCR